MAKSKIHGDISEEVNICAVLDTFMYMEFKDDRIENGYTISKIIDRIESNAVYSDLLKEEPYKIIKAAINERDPQTGKLTETAEYISNLKIGNQSSQMDESLKTAFACTFTDDNKKVYVAFRGTGDGEWIDNAHGMTDVSTAQQDVALKYFDTICKDKKWTAGDNIVITGHSKGGNKVQYIMLASEHDSYIDKCYALDGQGFSPEAIDALKNKYGEEAYNNQLDKMYAINGENDYVNELAIKVIREDHTFYVKTPVESLGLFQSFYYDHDISGMFTKVESNDELTYGGTLNDRTEQGLIGKGISRLSEVLINLPPDQRRDVSMTLMQLFEASTGQKDGLDGEMASLENYTGFVADGVPTILVTLLSTPEGRELLTKCGSDLFKEYCGKYGSWRTAGLAAGTFILLPYIVPVAVTGIGVSISIYEYARIINNIYDFVRNIEEFASDAYDFIVECGEVAKGMIEKLGDWYNKNLNSGYRYAVENPYIRVDVYKLRNYASQLENVQRRIHNLDRKLDSLYSDIISDGDLPGLRNLLKADILTGYSHQLQKCINYLNDTASDFEKVESKILSKLSELR